MPRGETNESTGCRLERGFSYCGVFLITMGAPWHSLATETQVPFPPRQTTVESSHEGDKAAREPYFTAALMKARRSPLRGRSQDILLSLVHVAVDERVAMGPRSSALRFLREAEFERAQIAKTLGIVLTRSDPRVAEEIVRTLTVFGQEARVTLPGLRALQKKASERLSNAIDAATWAIEGRPSESKVVAGIRSGLRSRSASTRLSAMETAVLLKRRMVMNGLVPDLLEIALDPEPDQLYVVSRALLCIGELATQGGEELLEALHSKLDENGEVGLCAAKSCIDVRSDDKPAIDYLLRVAGRDEAEGWDRCRALLVLRGAKGLSLGQREELLKLAKRPTAIPVALSAALAVSSFGPGESVRVATKLLDRTRDTDFVGWQFRAAAAACLAAASASHGRDDGRRRLVEALVDTDPYVREVAACSVASLLGAEGARAPEHLAAMVALKIKEFYSSPANLGGSSIWHWWW